MARWCPLRSKLAPDQLWSRPQLLSRLGTRSLLNQSGSVRLRLLLSDASGKPVTGPNRAIESDTSQANMGPGVAEAKEAEAGRYKAPLEFQMAGDWVILLLVTLSDRKKLERQIDVGRVRPNKASC
jgi:hypothetical protein